MQLIHCLTLWSKKIIISRKASYRWAEIHFLLFNIILTRKSFCCMCWAHLAVQSCPNRWSKRFEKYFFATCRHLSALIINLSLVLRRVAKGEGELKPFSFLDDYLLIWFFSLLLLFLSIERCKEKMKDLQTHKKKVD